MTKIDSKRYKTLLKYSYTICYKYKINKEIAPDILHDVLLQVILKEEEFPDKVYNNSYYYMALTNHCINIKTSKKLNNNNTSKCISMNNIYSI